MSSVDKELEMLEPQNPVELLRRAKPAGAFQMDPIRQDQMFEAIVTITGPKARLRSRTRVRVALPLTIAGLVGLSFAGAAVAGSFGPGAHFVPESIIAKFDRVLSTAPRLTSRAMLDRGGVRRLLTTTGRVSPRDSVPTTSTLADGTVLSPPPADATAPVSQSEAWSAFVAYGSPPDTTVLPSTPAPTIELAQLNKKSTSALVWVIAYQGLSIYPAQWNDHGVYQGGNEVPFNPLDSIGYLYVFVGAVSGQVLYTTAHATYL
jgi:hypothetical protein